MVSNKPDDQLEMAKPRTPLTSMVEMVESKPEKSKSEIALAHHKEGYCRVENRKLGTHMGENLEWETHKVGNME